MPLNVPLLERPRFFDLAPSEFNALIARLGWPAFRGKQVRDWVYNKLVSRPELMTNLPATERLKLADAMTFTSAAVTMRQDSNDGTLKLLLTWPDGSTAETVMIPDGDRRTACVSSQVGCPVGCKFCASGIGGVKGNLSAGQIVEQVYTFNQLLRDKAGDGRARDARKRTEASTFDAITNVVFMGMGEPMSNYANVMQAVRIMNDPECLGLGARRLTLSTVGVPSKMRELAHEHLPINLAISLHAPNEPLRKQLIPWAEHFALSEILDAARYYFEKTGREITLEYILLSGVNDRPEHAHELVRLCRTLRANVNLIRYNEVESLPFKRPTSHDVVTFQEILRRGGVNAHVRKSRGRDIDAACGQLRRKEQEKALAAT